MKLGASHTDASGELPTDPPPALPPSSNPFALSISDGDVPALARLVSNESKAHEFAKPNNVALPWLMSMHQTVFIEAARCGPVLGVLRNITKTGSCRLYEVE